MSTAFSPFADLTGMRALVTGASRGIGRAVALEFARAGADVIVHYRSSRDEAEAVAHECRALGRQAIILSADLGVEAELAPFVERAWGARLGLDVWVNNAGVELARSLDKFSADEWRQLLEINLSGAIAVTQAALPHLSAPGGVVVNIASALGLGGCPGFSIYSASKAGLIGFTQSLAWELAPRGIRVVAVAPGLVHTPMIHKHISQLTPEIWAQIEACHPLGMGRPDDVAAAVAFLASADARWITGIALPLGWAYHYPLPTGQMMQP